MTERPDPQTKTATLCDCERSHNGLGMAGRLCDCQDERPPPPGLVEAALLDESTRQVAEGESKTATCGQRRVAAAMALLDQRAEGGQCGEMVAEMLRAADATLMGALPSMLDANGTRWVEWNTLQELIRV